MKFSYTLLKKILPKVPPVGKLSDALNSHIFEIESITGDVLDIKLPANRYSDASSHIGIARELAAVFGLPFKSPIKTFVNLPSGKGFLKAGVLNKELCARYSARYFELSKIGASPDWLKKALKSCGVQSINSVVDAMNYAMLMTGQPLHAFDADELDGGIVVRSAKKGEKIITLDDRHIELAPDVLVIADEKRTLAIAGIKGGMYAGVTGKTRRIIIEGANFDATNIFKSSRALKLQTDASLRFAHDLSPALVGIGLDFATDVLTALGAILKDTIDIYPRKATEKVISFDALKYKKLIGAEANQADIKRYFTALGFEISGKKVRVPAWRTDVESFEDLAEELARFLGYGKLKGEPPTIAIRPPEENTEFSFSEKTREFFARAGFDEVYNSSFCGDGEEKEFPYSFWGKDAKSVELENPIVDDKKFLRKNLSAHLIKNASDNSRFFEKIRVFEIGKTFSSLGGKTKEKLVLGLCAAGKKDKSGVLELKGAIDAMLKRFGITEFFFEEMDGFLNLMVDGRQLGIIRVLSSVRGAKQWVAAVAELDADSIIKIISETHEFMPLPRYPEVVRDISFVVSLDVRIGDIVQEISNANLNLIEDVDLIDEYTDEKFGSNQSLTMRVVFQSDERTLSDEEVNKEMERITSLLARKFGAEIR